VGITQAKGWLKGIAAGAAFAALVALPMFSMSAGKVSYSDLSFGSGAGKVIFQDLAQGQGKVSFQDFHVARVSTGKTIPKATLY
jgi:hypothetical protein